MSQFYEMLRESPEFMTDPRVLRAPERLGGLCPLGHFPLGEGMSLRILGIPAHASYRPLWDVAAFGMLGTIVLLASPHPDEIARTAEVRAHLTPLRPNATLHLFLRSARLRHRLESAPSELGGVAADTVFAAPEPPNLERVAFLTLLLARLVP
jgi:hypothetical protein